MGADPVSEDFGLECQPPDRDDLRRVGATGIAVRGESPALLGVANGDALLRRVKGVLDPHGVFPGFERI